MKQLLLIPAAWVDFAMVISDGLPLSYQHSAGGSPFCSAPGLRLERGFKRRSRDAGGVIGDRRRRDNCDNLQEMVLPEAGANELVHVLIVKASTLLDQSSRQGR
jgi:hypothetical protein